MVDWPSRWPTIRRHRRPVTALVKEGSTWVEKHTGDALMASAALVTAEQVTTVLSRRKSWQEEAWDLYDQVPELRFGLEWLAAACSSVRFFPGRIDPDGSTDVARLEDDDPDMEALRQPLVELFGSTVGQGEMIRRLVAHFSVPGESFLVGFDDPEQEDRRRWIVLSREEISPGILGTGQVEIMLPDRPGRLPLNLDDGDAVMIRLWRPHPRIAMDPDSALIPLRGVLREILSLSASISAASDSRLAGAGILAVPDEITTPDARQSEGDVNPIHPDPFCAALITAMITPLKDRNSASAVAPMVVRGPADAIDKIKHLTFTTPFAERVVELRDAALRRMAIGLDLPAEVILGMGDVNHWGSWQIESQALKIAVSPLMGMLCEAITTQYYRPGLQALGVEDVESYAVGFDLSALAVNPNRGPDAQAAHDRLILSDASLLRALGFDEEDQPDDEEYRRRLAEKLVLGNAQLAPYLLPMLGLHVPGITQLTQPAPTVQITRTDEADDTGEADVQDDRQPPDADRQPDDPDQPPSAPASLPGQRRRELTAAVLPDQDPDLMAQAVLAAHQQAIEWKITALEVGVLRALERAGNWLLSAYGRTYRGQLMDVPLHAIHTRLPAQDNWLDKILENGYRELTASLADQPCLIETVDQYVRALLLAQIPHEREYLATALDQAGCDAAA